jgi:hypothetical protein
VDNKHYPDITDILERKERWRQQRAKLSFAEKLKILEQMRVRARPFVEAREHRKAQKPRQERG